MIRGFSALEVIIALAVLSTALIAVTLLTLGAPYILQNARDHAEALSLAQTLLAEAQHEAEDSFGSIASSSTTAGVAFDVHLGSRLLSDELTKRLTATVSWPDAWGNQKRLALESVVTDYEHATDYPCDSIPSGDWHNPVAKTSTLEGGDLLPGMDTYSIGSMATTRNLLALTSTSTKTVGQPSLFVFEYENGLPAFRSMLSTSSTTAAIADIALAGEHAYLASASACAKLASCGQLQIIDVSTPTAPAFASRLLLPILTPPYAGDTSGPVAAKSIYYRDGFIYLGLEETPTSTGMEFNIIDVQDSRNPIWRGGYRIGRTINDILVREGRAFVASNARGIADVVILDITDPADIRELVRIAFPPLQTTSRFGYAHGVAVSGSVLHIARSYISNADEWYLINLDDSAFPVIESKNVGTPLNRRSARGILVRDTLAALLTNKDFEIWDSSTDSLSMSSSLSIPGEAVSFLCVRNSFYIASLEAGVGKLTRIDPL